MERTLTPAAPRMFRHYLKLHFAVFLAGFTAIIGHEISLDSVTLVFWRTLVASVALALIIAARPPAPAPDLRTRLLMVGNGLVVGLHWVLFFLSVKIANVSVCLVGLATSALWAALLEPVLLQRRRPSAYEFGLGLVIVAAVALVFRPGFAFKAGLLVAIASALVATLFSLANGVFVRTVHHRYVALDGMVGACLFCAVLLPFRGGTDGVAPPFLPTLADVGWLLVLSLVCTVYAFSIYVELLKRLRVFAISLAFNLEPVYGIALAAVFLREYEQLSGYFYLGTTVLVAAVFTYPFVKHKGDILPDEGASFLPGAPPLSAAQPDENPLRK